MADITFNGHWLGQYADAEVVRNACVASQAESVAVPGVPGRALVSAEPGVRVIGVRLRLLPEVSRDSDSLAQVQREMSGWLAGDGGCDLELGNGLTCREAVCTGQGPWTRVPGEESCEVEFTCFDPVMHGSEAFGAGKSLTVGGTWRTWPRISLAVAADADAVTLRHVESGRSLTFSGEFGENPVIGIISGEGTVNLKGVPRPDILGIESDFFAFEPGANTLEVENAKLGVVAYEEAWM